MAIGERVRSRVEETVREHLQGGEELRRYAMCVVVRHQMLAFLLGPIAQAFTNRPHCLAVTDRRVLLLKPTLSGRSAELVFGDPLGTVEVVSAKDGLMRSKLRVRRASGQEFRLEFAPTWKKDGAAIRGILQAT